VATRAIFVSLERAIQNSPRRVTATLRTWRSLINWPLLQRRRFVRSDPPSYSSAWNVTSTASTPKALDSVVVPPGIGYSCSHFVTASSRLTIYAMGRVNRNVLPWLISLSARMEPRLIRTVLQRHRNVLVRVWQREIGKHAIWVCSDSAHRCRSGSRHDLLVVDQVVNHKARRR
jgi:hypothetical protein